MPLQLAAAVRSALAPSPWDIGNDVLYGLCRRYPLHTDGPPVIAKVWLIGRSYAAAIERRRNGGSPNDDFYVKTVAPKMLRSEVDAWISAAAKHKASDPASLDALLDAHARLTRLFRQITGLQKRSLASKYLHFHLPRLFFIYDARAVQAMRAFSHVVGRSAGGGGGLADREYRAFCIKCRRLQQHIRERFHASLTPRQLDNLLLKVYAGAT